RFYNLAWGAPYYHFHMDEHYVFMGADMLRKSAAQAAGSLKFFMYAPLPMYLVNIARAIYERANHPLALDVPGDEVTYMLLGRGISAAFGTATIPVVYAIGTRAAGLVAVGVARDRAARHLRRNLLAARSARGAVLRQIPGGRPVADHRAAHRRDPARLLRPFRRSCASSTVLVHESALVGHGADTRDLVARWDRLVADAPEQGGAVERGSANRVFRRRRQLGCPVRALCDSAGDGPDRRGRRAERRLAAPVALAAGCGRRHRRRHRDDGALGDCVHERLSIA